MGQAFSVLCKTCKTDFYLGYGGKKTHDSLLSKFKDEHPVDHDYDHNYPEYCTERDGKLWEDGFGYVDDQLMIDDYDSWKREDWRPKEND